MIKSLTIYQYSRENGEKYILTGMRNTQYDPIGNVVEISRWGITDNKYEMWNRIVYSYNPKGKIIEASEYNSDGTLDYRQIYKYDKNGNNIRTLTEDGGDYLEGETIAKYNSAGKMIESEERNPKGRLKEQINIKYNPKGEMVEERYKMFGNEEKLLRCYVNIFNYDPNGNLIEKKEYIIEKDSTKKLEISEDTLDTKTIYIYDSNDKLIEENKSDMYGPYEKIKYEDGNKVMKKEYNIGTIYKITLYEIKGGRVVERKEYDINNDDIFLSRYNIAPDPDRRYSYLYEEYR